MRVLFIYPDVYSDRFPYGVGRYHHGVGALAAYLKTHGIDVDLLHVTTDLPREKLLEGVRAASPDLVAFSVITQMSPYFEKWSRWIKAESDVPILVGGAHPSTAPERVIALDGVDMICRGEGEAAMLELCRRLDDGSDHSGVENLWVKKEDGHVVRNPVRPLVECLDELPFPDLDVFDYPNLLFPRTGTLPVMVSRGCPYQCTYCSNHRIRKLYPNKNKYVRFRSPEQAVEMINYLRARTPGARMVGFADDILFLDKKWFREFAHLYRTRVGLPFRCFGRANLMDEEVATLLEEAGCFRIFFGVESGNDHIRNEIMKRNISREKMIRAFRLAKEHNISTLAFNIVGVPEETMETIWDTIELNTILAPDLMSAKMFFPQPDTDLFRLCQERNLLPDTECDPDKDGPYILSPNLRPDQVRFAQRSFNLLVRWLIWCRKRPAFVAKPLSFMARAWFFGRLNPLWLVVRLMRVGDYFKARISSVLNTSFPAVYRRLVQWRLKIPS